MKISIAMATYNGEQFIGEQLHSYIAQTRLPDELIISDDRSSDRTLEIIEEFARIAPFSIDILRNSGRFGIAKNFETAIRHCSGDIIFLSDQDDVWFRDKLKAVEHLFSVDREAQVVINDAEITDERLRSTGIKKGHRIQRLGLRSDQFITGCCTAFRREMTPLICPIPDESFRYDSWIHQLGDMLGVRRYVPRVLQYYRRHDNNSSPWILSKMGRVSRMDLIKQSRRGDPRHWCCLRLVQLDLLSDRIGTGELMVSSVEKITQRAAASLGRIDEIRKAMAHRLALLEHPRRDRLMILLRMLIEGEYRHFNGWRSLFRDMLVS